MVGATRSTVANAAPLVPPFLACERCAHGRHQVDGLHCTLRRERGRTVPVAIARGRHGHCGPDARHQADPTDTPAGGAP